MERDLSERDYVYLWMDGIHTRVRLGSEARLCCLVMVGVRLDGTKELVALADDYRKSTESWVCLLRDLKGRADERGGANSGDREAEDTECCPARLVVDLASTFSIHPTS